MNECVICLNTTTNCDLRTLTCNHTFHTKCFAEWSCNSNNNGVVTCPCCRQSIADPFECYRSIEMLPSATEIVYIPIEVEVDNGKFFYSKCACVFGITALIQSIFIYTQIGKCS